MSDGFPTPTEYAAKLDELVERFVGLMRERPKLEHAKTRAHLQANEVGAGRATDAQVRVALREAKRIVAKSPRP